jgi:hypothetical protein
LTLPIVVYAQSITFDDLLQVVQSGADADAVLERCGSTVYTFSATQRRQLDKAGANAALIDALQKQRMALSDVRNFALILDYSGSMQEETPGGQSKMDAAKAALTQLLDRIPNGLNVCFLIYGHDVALKCKAVKVVRPLGKLDDQAKADLKAQIARLKPAGHTPIALASQTAGEALADADGKMMALCSHTEVRLMDLSGVTAAPK